MRAILRGRVEFILLLLRSETTRRLGWIDMFENEIYQADMQKFQGSWIQIAYERDGLAEPIDDEEGWNPRTIFQNGSFIVEISDGTIPIKGVFRIDPSKEPKQNEYTDTYGQYAGGNVFRDLCY